MPPAVVEKLTGVPGHAFVTLVSAVAVVGWFTVIVADALFVQSVVPSLTNTL